jgi:hypothetical protein
VCAAAALCVLVSVCMLLFDFRERQCAVVSVLCRCVAVCGTALHWTVAAAVSDSSRAAAVAMRRSLRSAVVLSHDTSGCSCILVALPPPSDAVLACWSVCRRL